MAEPLEQLLAQIRKPRKFRRLEYTAPDGGGDSPGMRGSISPLDSQGVSDRAQGIDISSMSPPTRLRADRMDEEMYDGDTPVNAGDEGGGERSPFMTAAGSNAAPRAARQTQYTQQGQVQYETQCDEGGCRKVPVASRLPPGVVEGPGEKYVVDSLRETSSSPSQAMPFAQATTAAPQFAAPQPQEGMSGIDPAAEQAWSDARNFAMSGQAVPAGLSQRQGDTRAQLGVLARQLEERREMRTILQGNITAGIALKNRALDLETNKLNAETGVTLSQQQDALRGDHSKPVKYRVSKIVASEVAARKGSTPMTEPEVAQYAKMEEGIVTATDLSYYLQGYEAALGNARAMSGKGEDAGSAMTEAAIIRGNMRQLLYDRYKDLPTPQERSKAVESELTPIYIRAYTKILGGDKAPPNEVQKKVIQRVRGHMLEVEDMTVRGEDPWKHYRSSTQATERAAPAQKPQNVFDGMDSDSGQALQPSGTTPSGGTILGSGGTFSLGR
jgi:hypothetical protein